MERTETEKFSHAKVGYEHPAQGKDHCSLCEHYLVRINAPRCEIVKSPIRPNDWCERFEPKS
jgi:hypothetical protein